MKFLKMLGSATAALAAVAAVPAISHAAEWAYPSKDVNLRAGPAIDYPLIARLPAGVAISVEGCMEDYRWCDVVAGQDRGWVYAGNLVYPHQGENVPVLGYGAAIGIGILAFSLAHYWDNHYRTRPWYPQRQRWIDRPGSGFAPRAYRSPQGPAVRQGNFRPSQQAPAVRQAAPVPPPQRPAVRLGGTPPTPQARGSGEVRRPAAQTRRKGGDAP